MTLGQQIVEEAYRAFDEWLSAQSDEVRDMEILEQAALYATQIQYGAA